MDSKHKQIKFNCPQCGKLLTSIGHVSRHTNNIHKAIKHTCNICLREFIQASTKILHMRAAHKNNKKFTCSICKFQSSYAANLKQHEQSVHQGVKHNCQICGHVISTRSDLTKHIQIKYEGKKFQCAICSVEYSTPEVLYLHRQSKH